MKLTVQEQCDQLVEQFYDEFATLRRDVSAAVKGVARVWEEHFPDPTDMHGMLYCTSVRGVLLLNRVGGPCNPDEEPPAGVVRTRYGQGMSVVIGDGRGMRSRVRKAPAEFFPERGERLVIRYPKDRPDGADVVTQLRGESAADAAEASQTVLTQEMATLPRTANNFDWFVLWTLSEDGLQVPDVFLAAVVDIDSPSKVVILASTPLPRKARPQVVADEHDDDFGGYFGDQGEEGTGSPSA
ncbi:hypothetical protein G4X40_04345 [Rhodococcus sp. D2-41]|uniref:Uncharacterized protein n=1 Tax=Speluncibacter jeojiensis TaxID=2710754 RepID=A0A9X4MB13_9ACTN|nr:hypothetical protein [Rhodococcus sp. D2-41]MDG3009373.1 hypothetical protein [Rhodococcus sp. D2-41]MDG3017251.1 hypothetical protein [Corynebacteriales bacterium D3-21]